MAMESVSRGLVAVSKTIEKQFQEFEQTKKDIREQLQHARSNTIMIADLKEQQGTKEKERTDLEAEIKNISSRLQKLKAEAGEDQLKKQLEKINNGLKTLKTLNTEVDEAEAAAKEAEAAAKEAEAAAKEAQEAAKKAQEAAKEADDVTRSNAQKRNVHKDADKEQIKPPANPKVQAANAGPAPPGQGGM